MSNNALITICYVGCDFLFLILIDLIKCDRTHVSLSDTYAFYMKGLDFSFLEVTIYVIEMRGLSHFVTFNGSEDIFGSWLLSS